MTDGNLMRRSGLFLGLLSAFCTNVPPKELWQPAIAFVSTRDDPGGDFFASEIYLMNGDGTGARRITNNRDADFFPSISPDGRRMVFESNRLLAADEPRNVSDLFLMNVDGAHQTHLARGSSATWSPDGRKIAFHASASGKGQPIVPFPGAATSDSDIFVLDIDGTTPRNITNNPAAIDDDPDWSPDGRTILFTSHAVTDKPTNATSAEIYIMNADGSGQPMALTHNQEEERAPSWSPDRKRILFCCRRGAPTFEICVMNADGTGEVQLTHNNVADLTPSWSPDGKEIAFHRTMGGRGSFQIWTMKADGSDQKQITDVPGANAFPHWGRIRLAVHR